MNSVKLFSNPKTENNQNSQQDASVRHQLNVEWWKAVKFKVSHPSSQKYNQFILSPISNDLKFHFKKTGVAAGEITDC